MSPESGRVAATRHAVAGRSRRAARLARAAAAVAAVLLALLAAAPVSAHAELVSSDPADKAVLDTPPTSVVLTFDEGLAAKSSFKLIGPDGSTIGTATPDAANAPTMTLDGLSLAPGAYTVEWTSVGADGDVERGKLTFTVTEPTPAPATPTPAPESAAPSQAPSSTPAPAATPAPSPSDAGTPASSSGGDVLLPIIAALALVGVVGALVLRRSRAA